MSFEAVLASPPFFDQLDPAVTSLLLGRAATAGLVGAGLGAAGAALQRYLNNDLADPYVLGVSGAAVLGSVAVGLLAPATTVLTASPGALLALSLVGAACGGTLVLGVLLWGRERLYRNVAGLVLLGVIINAFCSSLTMLLMAFDHPLYPQIDYGLLVGRIESYSPVETFVLFLLVGLGLALLWAVRSFVEWAPYGGSPVGASPVPSSASPVRRLVPGPEATLLCGVAIIACTAGAFVGSVGFVGLMAPHLARGLCRRYRTEFWLAAVIGGVGLICADMLAQRIVWPRVLPVGVATSLLGALGMAWLLRSRLHIWRGMGRGRGRVSGVQF